MFYKVLINAASSDRYILTESVLNFKLYRTTEELKKISRIYCETSSNGGVIKDNGIKKKAKQKYGQVLAFLCESKQPLWYYNTSPYILDSVVNRLGLTLHSQHALVLHEHGEFTCSCLYYSRVNVIFLML